MLSTRMYAALASFSLCLFPICSYGEISYEINGSPYGTDDAPISQYIKPPMEKLIIVDPNEHVWGAYNPKGRLVRWGIASAGSNWCSDLDRSCRTKSGVFRIYSLGNSDCISKKFPLPTGGASMPYCMYFNGGQALHGSDEVDYGNVSHGCIRIHVSDAKWLRYKFVEGPSQTNYFRGTKIIIKAY